MNKIRRLLLRLLFPEYLELIKQINSNNKFILNKLKTHENILSSEIWQAIKEKYESHE